MTFNSVSLLRLRHFGWLSSSTMPGTSALKPFAASSPRTHLETVAPVSRRSLAKFCQHGSLCKKRSKSGSSSASAIVPVPFFSLRDGDARVELGASRLQEATSP